MKNIIYVAISIILLVSCEMTEKVYLEESGEVKYALDIDMSQMKYYAGVDITKDQDLPMDTIIDLSDIQNSSLDSTKNLYEVIEKKNYEALFKDFKVHIVINEIETTISLFTQKKNLNELNQYFIELDKMRFENHKNLNDSLNLDDESEFELPMQTLKLDYTGNTFSRNGSFSYDLDDSDDDEDMAMERLQELVMESIKYNIEYHFPKAVATISDSTAIFSADRKTIFIRKPFNQLVENPEAYDFMVTFK